MQRQGRSVPLAGLLLVVVGGLLAGCGDGSSPRIVGIGPDTLVGSPGGVPFVVTWDSAGRVDPTAGQRLIVRFSAATGTPFEGGTSRTADVEGTVLDARRVEGLSPPSTASTRAFVTVIVPGTDVAVVSDAAIAEIVSNPPVAMDQAYDAIGNVGFSEDAANGLLQGDFDPDGDAIALVAAQSPSANGGTVVAAADGSFSYEPPAGFQGVDTFTYTISDGVLEATATVSVTIDEVVWFIDGAAAPGGDGRFATPFETLAAFNLVQGAGPLAPGPGDVVFVYQNGGTPYAGNLTLLEDQVLVGQGVDLIVSGQLLVGRTANPVIEAASGFTVQAAARTEIHGVDLVNTDGGGIHRLFSLGDGFLTIDETTILTTGGPALFSTSPDDVVYTVVLGSADVHDSDAGGIVLHGGTGLLEVGEAVLAVTGGPHAALDLEGTGAQALFARVDLSSTNDAVDFDGATGRLEILSGDLEAAGRVLRAVNAGGPTASPARVELSGATLVQTGAISTPAVEARLSFPLEDRVLEVIVADNTMNAAHGIQVEVSAGDEAAATVRCRIEGNLLSGAGDVTLLGSVSGRLDVAFEMNAALPGAVVTVTSDVEGLVCARIEGNAFDLYELIAGDDATFGIACSDGLCTIADEFDAIFAVALRNTGAVNAASGTNSTWYECSGDLQVP